MSAYLTTDCDRTVAKAAPPPSLAARANAHPGLILATTILASSLAFIDGSVVNVGLPAIGRDLHADGAGLAWIINGYLLPLTALLLLGGAAGDRFGRRRVLLIGITIFALASALCAAAGNLAWLIAGRVLQGASAALLMPNSLAILGTSFAGEARGRAIGIWASAGAAAGALGPLVGGGLIDVVGWRPIFLINLPVAALAMYLGVRSLHDEPDRAVGALDVPGAALATVGLAALTWGLTSASAAGGLNAMGAALLGAGVLILVLFLLAERRAGDAAMLPLVLFASRSFVGLNLLTFLLYGALGAVLVAVPFVLIQVEAYSAVAAGASLLPLPIVIGLGSSTMGRVAVKTGPRLPLTLGSVIVALGCFLAVRIGHGPYWATALPALLLVALGMACAVAPLTTAILTAVDAEHAGVASGVNSAVARAGGLIATSLLGTVLSAQGAALLATFRVAVIVAGVAALAAALCAFTLVEDPPAK
jgi:EmrB/QacA subfamily drug resistance transporter